jgi:hypothetical protein
MMLESMNSEMSEYSCTFQVTNKRFIRNNEITTRATTTDINYIILAYPFAILGLPESKSSRLQRTMHYKVLILTK